MAVTVRLMMEMVIAAHRSSRVESRWGQHGGIMLVGPPGMLKTTIVSVLDSYPDALILSDINAQSLNKLKGDISSGAIRTLALSELQKVYERAEHTASNVEGTLRALVSEGFSAASFEDSQIQRLKARCVLVAGITPTLHERMAQRWQESGFSRRFLWCLFTGDTSKLDNAVVDGTPLDFGLRTIPPLPKDPIPDTTTFQERQRLHALVKHQPKPHSEQLVLLIRMLAVLKWWHRQERFDTRPLSLVTEWAQTLNKHGAVLSYEGRRRNAR